MSSYCLFCLCLCIFTELRSYWVYSFKFYLTNSILQASFHVSKYVFSLILVSMIRFPFIRTDHILSTQSPRAGHLGCFEFFSITSNILTTKPLYYSCSENIHEVIFFFLLEHSCCCSPKVFLLIICECFTCLVLKDDGSLRIWYNWLTSPVEIKSFTIDPKIQFKNVNVILV